MYGMVMQEDFDDMELLSNPNLSGMKDKKALGMINLFKVKGRGKTQRKLDLPARNSPYVIPYYKDKPVRRTYISAGVMGPVVYFTWREDLTGATKLRFKRTALAELRKKERMKVKFSNKERMGQAKSKRKKRQELDDIPIRTGPPGSRKKKGKAKKKARSNPSTTELDNCRNLLMDEGYAVEVSSEEVDMMGVDEEGNFDWYFEGDEEEEGDDGDVELLENPQWGMQHTRGPDRKGSFDRRYEVQFFTSGGGTVSHQIYAPNRVTAKQRAQKKYPNLTFIRVREVGENTAIVRSGSLLREGMDAMTVGYAINPRSRKNRDSSSSLHYAEALAKAHMLMMEENNETGNYSDFMQVEYRRMSENPRLYLAHAVAESNAILNSRASASSKKAARRVIKAITDQHPELRRFQSQSRSGMRKFNPSKRTRKNPLPKGPYQYDPDGAYMEGYFSQEGGPDSGVYDFYTVRGRKTKATDGIAAEVTKVRGPTGRSGWKVKITHQFMLPEDPSNTYIQVLRQKPTPHDIQKIIDRVVSSTTKKVPGYGRIIQIRSLSERMAKKVRAKRKGLASRAPRDSQGRFKKRKNPRAMRRLR